MKLNLAALGSLLLALATIFFYAPEEATQGIVQKIFYIHVASAITMYIGFFIGFLSSLLYLLEKKVRWDELSAASIEAGFFLCTMVLVTGPIWAKPIWGVWWDWDPRLTTTLLLWLLYAGYFVLRGYFGATSRGRMTTAIIAVVAFLDVPLIHFSVRLWRGVHPSVMQSRDGLPLSMQQTLGVTFVAVVLTLFALMRMRFQLERLRNELLRLRSEQGRAT